MILGCWHLDAQILAAEAKMDRLLPEAPFAPLTTVPGWGTIRAANYGAAVGDPGRWRGARQLYRASGLSQAQYESAGKRRDGSITREGRVALRRALIDLGIGLWRSDPSACRYDQQLRARGKKGGVIGCAMANRANRSPTHWFVIRQATTDTLDLITPGRFPRSRPAPPCAAAAHLERPQRSEDERG
jgi:transposase